MRVFSKIGKRLLGVLVSASMVFSLVPGMATIADGEHQIINTISDVVELSITKEGNAITSASSGDVITLAVVGTPRAGGTGWTTNDRNVQRTITVDGLAVTGNSGSSISVASTGGAMTWTFTMPDEDVYVSFPMLTAGSALSVDTGTAVFRSGISNGGDYSFVTTMSGGTYRDTVGYLVYQNGTNLYKVCNDDSGGDLNFRLPPSGTITINDGTYFHIGFGLYNNTATGSFTPDNTSGNITISYTSTIKNAQTISASDVNTSYGATDAVVGASVTTGDGTLSYSVTGGTDVITVDRDSGAITTIKAGIAQIEIVASETDTYRRTTQTITVIVDKADCTVTPPTGNTLAYTEADQQLIVAGSAEGGTMLYSLSEDGEFSEEIPVAADPGTYTVYYKVVGDENHNDVAPQSVTATIAEPGSIAASVTGFEGEYDGEEHGVTVNVTDPADGAVIMFGEAEGTYDLAESPAYTEVGTYTVYYSITATGYDDMTGSVVISILEVEEPEEEPTPTPEEPEEEPVIEVEPALTPEQIRDMAVRHFVERLYLNALDREYDVAGRDGWVDLLVNRNGTGSQVVSGFVNSEEFIARDLNDFEYVTTLYKAFFDRVPSTEELDNWVNALSAGASRESVFNQFVVSPEWYEECAYYGINP